MGSMHFFFLSLYQYSYRLIPIHIADIVLDFEVSNI